MKEADVIAPCERCGARKWRWHLYPSQKIACWCASCRYPPIAWASAPIPSRIAGDP